ncbi:hypothetical protein BVX99_01040 [bacterium F16]|nr:hypothetical protein BVX99_01040 [bacterium F16]
MSEKLFSRCSTCGYLWKSRDHFLADPRIEMVGYQVQFDELLEGLFMFNHRCGTTLSLKVEIFRNLYNGSVFEECQKDEPGCSGMCIHRENLMPCPLHCECSFVREIIQIIKTWPKAGTPKVRSLPEL